MSRNRPNRRPMLVAGWAVWLGVAFAGVPFAWSGALARWLAFGLSARPYWPLTVLALVAVLVGLSRWLPCDSRPRLGPMSFALAAGWCLVHSACWLWQVSNLSETGVVAIYLSTTLWLACGVRLCLTKAAWPLCAKWLAVSFLPLLLGAAVVDFGGLDGNGRPIVRWRFESVANAAALPIAERRPTSPGLPPATQHDFSAFRGNNGSGVVRDVKLDPHWSSHAPRLLWRRDIGKGWGGFAVMGGYAYTQEQRGADESIVCYQAETGRECWAHADQVGFTSATAGDGPRATPTVRDGRVYSLGATGLLNCLDAGTGVRYWSVDVLAEHHAGNLYHGLSGSPLVVGDLVMVSVGGPGRSLVAYDRLSGRLVWHAGDDPAGYGSPLVCTLCGCPQIVILTQAGLAAHDVSSGDVLWTFPWTNESGTNCSQPLPVGDDRVFVSTGYGRGCALVRVQTTTSGWSVESLWTSRNLKTKFSSPVARDGFVFGLDEGRLVCLDLRDGARRWRAGRYGHGQLLLVDDLLCVQCETGELALVAADPTAHRELARYDALADKTWNYPALAGRLLLVRNDREAICFELPGH